MIDPRKSDLPPLELPTVTVTVSGIAPSADARSGPERRFADGDLLFDRFRVIRFIAAGGMGEVYEVEDRRLQGVRLALKTIRPDIAAKRDMQERFEREVLLARSVVHPNLCPIYDIFHGRHQDTDLTFLTMKLLPGETLASRLKREAVIPLAEATEIVSQVGAALTAAHAAGVLHRDIKTANIMLDGTGPEVCAWVTDFGLARAYQTESTVLTLEGVAGTPGYVAPELFHGAPPSKASDVYAFGVVAYKMVVGHSPSSRLDASGPPLADAALDALPAAWKRMIEACLEPRPSERCQSFPEVLELLREGRIGAQATSLSMPRLSRRRLLTLSATATAGAAAAAWLNRSRISLAFHPLPAKRFVALLDWPATSDTRFASMIGAVIDAIGSELSRAEAYDRNLFIIPQHIGKNVTSLKQLNDIRESVGANLVLAATGAPGTKELQLLLKVIDPAASRTLREKTIEVPLNEQLSLPERAVRVAAELLNITQYRPDDQRSKVGTSDPEAYAAFQAAEGLMQQENDSGLSAAIEKYKQAIEVDPHFAIANSKLALAYFRSYILHRDPAALVLARGNCQTALSLNPNLVEAHLALASVLDWTGEKGGALREISNALSIDPANPRAMLFQGQAFTRSNRWQDAEATFARLQRARPNYWLAHEELGIAFYSEGKYANASTEFRAASLAAPKRTLPLANLSVAFLQMGRLDDALEAARKALAIAPDDGASSAIAAALRCRGKANEALPYILKAVEINPDWPGNWIELGDNYSSMKGRKAEAREAFAKAAKLQQQTLQTNPTEGPTWMSLALAQAKIGDLQSSAKSVQMADNNFAGDLDSQLTKVRVLELLGRRDEAFAIVSACFARGANKFQFQTMPDIDGLRNDLRFKSALASVPSTNA